VKSDSDKSSLSRGHWRARRSSDPPMYVRVDAYLRFSRWIDGELAKLEAESAPAKHAAAMLDREARLRARKPKPR
jgi:hypothetical protein